MATEKEKESAGLSTAEKDKLDDNAFAFPRERKEPLVDASHVRNAVARFDQVEGVTDAERDKAWKRILTAAKRYDVEVSESSWRELGKSGKAGKNGKTGKSSTAKSTSTAKSSSSAKSSKASKASKSSAEK